MLVVEQDKVLAGLVFADTSLYWTVVWFHKQDSYGVVQRFGLEVVQAAVPNIAALDSLDSVYKYSEEVLYSFAALGSSDLEHTHSEMLACRMTAVLDRLVLERMSSVMLVKHSFDYDIAVQEIAANCCLPCPDGVSCFRVENGDLWLHRMHLWLVCGMTRRANLALLLR
jgi:hypothetical protein